MGWTPLPLSASGLDRAWKEFDAEKTRNLGDAPSTPSARQAEAALVGHYLALVLTVARQMRPLVTKQVDFEDLMASGAQGLLLAIRLYRHAGASFQTYAIRKIQGYIVDGVKTYGPVPRRFVCIMGKTGPQSLDAVEEPGLGKNEPPGDMEKRDQVAALLQHIRPSDRNIAMMYYADGLTMKEIGLVLGRSENRVSQRLKAILAELREGMEGGPA